MDLAGQGSGLDARSERPEKRSRLKRGGFELPATPVNLKTKRVFTELSTSVSIHRFCSTHR